MEKPATTDFFGRMKAGLQSWCKECKRAYYLENREVITAKNRERYRAKHPNEILPDGFKRCSVCKEVRPTEHFGRSSSSKDGLRSQCKECRKAQYRRDAETIKAKRKRHYQKNKERILQQVAAYRQRNQCLYREYYQKYYSKNAERIKLNVKRARYRRLQSDIEFRLLSNYRTRIYKALKGIEKPARTEELIGCTIEELKAHLEKQFRPGMSWNNYGEWHVDHIRPCSSFDLTDEAQARECFHYTNLQPLWAHENIAKSDKAC